VVASDRRRCAANALQLLDPRPRRRPLALAMGDERLELGAGELGHVGADRLAREGRTFHRSNVLPASCPKRVSTLSGSGK
jgi:hypothetical protein